MHQYCLVVSPIIGLVMNNDNYELKKDSIQKDYYQEMNFNRIETFIEDTILYKSKELVQRDWHYLTPLHYLKNNDIEIDMIFNSVFNAISKGDFLPIANRNITQ